MLLAALTLLPLPFWTTVPGPERVDRALVALRVVRDLDRDGVQDVCVRLASDGRAQIALISAAQGTTLWIADGPASVLDASRETMPGAIAPLGDHDGDGLGEIAVLWRDTESSGEVRGIVLAIHAGADGRVVRAIDVGEDVTDARAAAVTASGDLDGDLLPDLIVLAPAREPFTGEVRALSSANGAELWSAPTRARGDATGASIAILRDVDGDATVDLALIADGGVDVLSGRDGRRLKHVESSSIDAYAPTDAAGEADVGSPQESALASDGSEELARTADGAHVEGLRAALRALTTAVENLSGAERAHATGGARPSALETPRWIASGSIAVIGDLDADAVLDLYVPQRASVGRESSVAIVSVGRAILIERRALPVASFELGASSFRVAGDVDGDKRIDVLCGDPGWNARACADAGAVRVLGGLDGRELRAWHGGPTVTRLGAHAASAGDVDRDGVNDVWMSAVDVASYPRAVIALASGRTGAFLQRIDLGRLSIAGRP